jgi:hypothetical protein
VIFGEADVSTAALRFFTTLRSFLDLHVDVVSSA